MSFVETFRENCLRADVRPNEGYSLFECYSFEVFVHLLAVFLQRSNAAGPGGCLPCPGSWP